MTCTRVLCTAFVLLHLTAPTSPAQTTPCDCAELFAFVAGYTERNYAGFRDKVTTATRPAYDSLRGRLGDAASSVTGDDDCQSILDEYIAFFRDRHFSVGRSGRGGSPASDDAIRARFSEWPSRPVSEAALRERVTRNPPRGDALDGIWEIVGADYRMAMAPGDAPGTWEAVILRSDSVWWTPGQVKGRFRRTGPGEFVGETYLRDHTPVRSPARLGDGVLTFGGGGVWARTWPDNPSGYDRARYDLTANRALAVRELDAETMLVQLPTFSGSQAGRIDSLIAANWDRLTSRQYLIIDVRGNGGGADRSFQSLRPLLYTRPVISTGLALYATEENIAAILGTMRERGIPVDVQPQVDSMVAEARARLGEFLVRPPQTHVLDDVPSLPRRVAVLTDRFCASSCEAFVLVALQSDRTTVFGENTGGLLDYGNVTSVSTTCPSFHLGIPTSRSNHLDDRSYDNVGIAPTVRVPEGVVYWLEWVHRQILGR